MRHADGTTAASAANRRARLRRPVSFPLTSRPKPTVSAPRERNRDAAGLTSAENCGRPSSRVRRRGLSLRPCACFKGMPLMKERNKLACAVVESAERDTRRGRPRATRAAHLLPGLIVACTFVGCNSDDGASAAAEGGLQAPAAPVPTSAPPASSEGRHRRFIGKVTISGVDHYGDTMLTADDRSDPMSRISITGTGHSSLRSPGGYSRLIGTVDIRSGGRSGAVSSWREHCAAPTQADSVAKQRLLKSGLDSCWRRMVAKADWRNPGWRNQAERPGDWSSPPGSTGAGGRRELGSWRASGARCLRNLPALMAPSCASTPSVEYSFERPLRLQQATGQ